MKPTVLAASSLSITAKLSLLLLAGLTLALSVQLWPEWRHNLDFSHGLFMPLLFALLLIESRGTRSPAYLKSGVGKTVLLTLLVLLSATSLTAAGLYAAALGWSHALVEFLLTFSLVSLLGAALCVFSSDQIRLIPFNWSAVVAVGLWLLCTPLPPGTYSRLTLTLQLWVSENVLRTLHLLGIAAHRTGNIIELAHGSVGVEEACSGVRSLLSCLFTAFFLSATIVRRPAARAVIILLAVPLALALNFFRSLILTLLANSDTPLATRWHDLTGYAVLVLAAALLAGTALLLERRARTATAAPIPSLPIPSRTTPPSLIALTTSLVLGSALVAFFAFNTRSVSSLTASPPNLLALLPAAPVGWKSAAPADLSQFSGTLETQHLAQRTYTASASNPPSVQITLYLAYWPAGQSTVSRVAAHTPDACWPGSGWTPESTPFSREIPLLSTRTLPTAEYRLFSHSALPQQHVWFWHLFEGHPISVARPDSPRALLALAWRYGFRRDGDQLFVRVSSNQPWSTIAANPLVRDFFAQLQPLGL